VPTVHHSPREIDDEFYAKLDNPYSHPQIVELIATASVFEFFPRFVMRAAYSSDPSPQEYSCRRRPDMRLLAAACR
jgi:hypothetical protein